MSSRASYGRRRAASLLLVHVLMVAHFVHWKLAGRTLAPLELNEVMHTLELGIVTAGFLLMASLVVATAIFGRFFCSWGCHILALEDGAAWILDKLGVRPKQVRSRALALVPFGAMLYMFVWPQVTRMLRGRPFPGLHVEGEGSAWASFLTDDYSRNLPGPWIAGLTFFVCGFAIVYVLGSRTFCRYACPYGAVFRLADRVAPGRIVRSKGCDACGLCTASCQSDIAVHKELATYGTVVDPACLKDLDCLAACPDGAITYGFTKPSLLRRPVASRSLAKRYDYSWPEELAIVVVFLYSLLVLRGLYGVVPFLLSLALAGIAAFLSIHVWRLATRTALRFGKTQLKLSGKVTGAGWVFAGVATLTGVALAHSGLVRYHQFEGERAYERVSATDTGTRSELDGAIASLESARSLGLAHIPGVDQKLAGLYSVSPRPERAEDPLRRMLARDPDDLRARKRLIHLLHRAGGIETVDRELDRLLAAAEKADDRVHALAAAHELRGVILLDRGRLEAGLGSFQRALDVHPTSASSLRWAGETLAHMGRMPEAIERFEAALAIDAESAAAHYNLAVLLAVRGERERALEHYEQALALAPEDPEIRSNLGLLYLEMGQAHLAATQLATAIELAPSFAPAHFNQGRLLLMQGRRAEAMRAFERAAELDPRFAGALAELER